MKTIWKYPLEFTDKQIVQLPWGARILDVQEQDGLCLWAMIDPKEERKIKRHIFIIGTGWNPMCLDHMKHISTLQQKNTPLVFHIFEVIGEEKGS